MSAPHLEQDTPDLPSRIRHLANLAGGTGKLAAALDWPQRTLQRYASGATVPSRAKLFHLAIATGCRPQWLLNGSGEKPIDPFEVLTAMRRANRNLEDDWYPVAHLPGDNPSPCPVHYVSKKWAESIVGPLDSHEPIGCFRVRDSSMAPLFLPGDTVFVAPDPIREASDIVEWRDYAVRLYGEWCIRRKTPQGWEAITQGAACFPFDETYFEVYGRAFAKVQVL